MLTFDKTLLLMAVTVSCLSWAPTSSTVTDRPDSGYHRGDPDPGSYRGEPDSIVAQHQGAVFSRSPGRQPKTAEQRDDLESMLRYRIQTEILRILNNRTTLKLHGSGGDEVTNGTLFESKEKQEESKDRKERKTAGHGKAKRAILRTILFGEKVANLTDDGVVQFRLNDNSNRDLLVTAATVTVLIRPERTGISHWKSEPKPLTIRIYALAENDTRPGAGDPLTELSIRARRAKVQRLLLPTSFIQRALDSQETVLRLKIVCDSCGVDDGEEEGRRSRKAATTTRKRPRARHNLQKTPFLTINSKRKQATPRARSRMQAARSSRQ